MTNTSIDELLGYEDEATAGAGTRWTAVLAQTLLWAGLAVLGVVAGLRLIGVAVPLVLVVAGVLALFALRHLLRSVAAPNRSRYPTAAGTDTVSGLGIDESLYKWPAPDAMRLAVARWEHRLSWYAEVPASFPEQLQPALRDLAGERLRQEHGVTIEGDPERARLLLGEPLWAVLTGDRRRGPGQRELARLVAALEDLAGSAADSVAGSVAGTATDASQKEARRFA